MNRRGARRLIDASLVLLLLGLAAQPILAQSRTTGHVNFSFGTKQMDDDWEPVEDQGAFGFGVSWGKRTWPVHIVIDVLASYEKEEIGSVDFEGSTGELGLGLQKTWDIGSFHPFLAAGIAAVYARAEVDVDLPSPLDVSASEDELGGGVWTKGGVFWRLGSNFNIGLSVRYSAAEVTFDSVDLSTLEVEEIDLEAGGLHAGLLLGWGWPGR